LPCIAKAQTKGPQKQARKDGGGFHARAAYAKAQR